MRDKGLKEQRIAITHIPTDIKLFTYNSADIEASPAGLLVRYMVK